MAVVPFPNLPPQGPGGGMEWELRTISARQMSPLDAVATTLERAGSHWAVRMPYENLATDRRARMQTLAASLRGFANRTYVPVYGWTRRGSFPATELWPNTAFDNTTGLTASSETALTVSDNVLRAARTAVVSNQFLRASSAVTVTQYAPYALRFIAHQGRGAYAAGLTPYSYSTLALGPTVTTFGRVDGVVVPLGTTLTPALLDNATSGLLAGDYYRISFASFARCALVDNAPNSLLQSDTLGTTWTQSGLSALNSNAFASPDGTTTADAMVENSSAGSHGINQSGSRTNVAADLCAFGYFGRFSGTRNIRLWAGNDGTDGGSAVFDLGSGTIAAGPTNNGAATDARAFIVNAGNGYYFCAVVARLPAASTIAVFVQMADGTAVGYTGNGTSSILGWRVGGAVSSVPTRGGLTVGTAAAAGTAQTGSALYLKGLPASTNGLLLQGDPAEIITGTTRQLVRVRSSLNSDAAGLGYLEFEPPLRVSPSDNAAVIVQNPMCRMMSDRAVNGWRDRMGGFADTELALVEDTYP